MPLITPTPAGDFNYRVTLQRPVKVEQDNGEVTITYSDAAAVWAAIFQASAGREGKAADAPQQVEVRTHDIRIRWRGDVDAGWRVKFRDRLFAIVGINDVGQARTELQLQCSERAWKAEGTQQSESSSGS